MREHGRKAEHSLRDAQLQSFLVLRRFEKNVMLYRSRESYAVFRKACGATSFANNTEIRSYQALVSKLYALYEAEKDSVEKLRQTARQIQSFTQNLSKKERSDIATTIKMSINLQVAALVLVIAVGTIINVKLATSIASPIRTLEKITQKISRGDFSERIEVKGGDELASLEASFNLMEEKLKTALWSLEHTIEKLREKQAQLVEAEKLASVGKLAAGIAHEINNPLTSVLTFSNLMLEQCPPTDPRYEKLKLMARETGRARNIVRQLLNFGRESLIKPVKININQPVSEITDSLVAQDAFKGIELDMQLAENLPEVYADPAQMGQVVLNILLNAIHSISPPGRIGIRTGLKENIVELAFSDTGAGIPEEHLHKIFDPFFTTKDVHEGDGVGTCRQLWYYKKTRREYRGYEHAGQRNDIYGEAADSWITGISSGPSSWTMKRAYARRSRRSLKPKGSMRSRPRTAWQPWTTSKGTTTTSSSRTSRCRTWTASACTTASRTRRRTASS